MHAARDGAKHRRLFGFTQDIVDILVMAARACSRASCAAAHCPTHTRHHQARPCACAAMRMRMRGHAHVRAAPHLEELALLLLRPGGTRTKHARPVSSADAQGGAPSTGRSATLARSGGAGACGRAWRELSCKRYNNRSGQEFKLKAWLETRNVEVWHRVDESAIAPVITRMESPRRPPPNSGQGRKGKRATRART